MFIYAIAAVAEVRNTSRSEGGDVQQTVTAVESWSCKDLLTERFLQDRRTERQIHRHTENKKEEKANRTKD